VAARKQIYIAAISIATPICVVVVADDYDEISVLQTREKSVSQHPIELARHATFSLRPCICFAPLFLLRHMEPFQL